MPQDIDSKEEENFAARVDKKLKARAVAKMKLEHVSIQQFVDRALREYLGELPKAARKPVKYHDMQGEEDIAYALLEYHRAAQGPIRGFLEMVERDAVAAVEAKKKK